MNFSHLIATLHFALRSSGSYKARAKTTFNDTCKT